ncbi:glycosyltransferase family 4 protein [bacterium]|nr:glycosyltransferase family 4 protein [bacterium]
MEQVKKKVLVVSTIDLTPYCFLRAKFRAMVTDGYEVTLACSVQKFRRELEATGIKVVDVPMSRSISPWQDLLSLWSLIKLIREIDPDIIHTHTSKAGFLGRLAGFLCRVPLRVHTIHELPENSVSNPLTKLIYRYLEWWAACLAHHHFTVSTPNFKQIVSEGICPASKLSIVREGCIDLEKYKPVSSHAELCDRLHIDKDSLIIGTVGRLERAKGHADLIESFKLLLTMLPPELAPKAHLVIVGQGALYEDLQNLVCKLDLQDRVTLVGWVDNLLEYLGNFDIYALASLYEGLGVANMEAMAMRRPVVCTGVGGVIDVVDDGINGLLVSPHNPAQMANALYRLCTDKELASKLAEAGREKIEREFQEEPQAQRLLELYAKLLETYHR